MQLNSSLEILLPDTSTSVNIPFINGIFSAGFSSPADDYIEDFLDLNKKYVVNEPATVMLRITGNSMCDAGINNGDIIIVDKSLEPRNNKIAVCSMFNHTYHASLLSNNPWNFSWCNIYYSSTFKFP